MTRSDRKTATTASSGTNPAAPSTDQDDDTQASSSRSQRSAAQTRPRSSEDRVPELHGGDDPHDDDGDALRSDDGLLEIDDAAAGVDEDIFADDLVPLHPTVADFIKETAPYDRVLPEHLRKRLLRHFPPVQDFSVRAPQADQAFATLAHPSTLRRDRQLINLQILQLQAVRPLLMAWSAMLDVDQPTERERNVIEALRASVSLSLHAASTTTNVRRQWVLHDVNPSLVRSIREPQALLFGPSITERIQQADAVATTVRRMQHHQQPQQRPNGQRRDQGLNNRSNNSSNNRFGRNNNYNNNNGNNFGNFRNQRRNNYNTFNSRNNSNNGNNNNNTWDRNRNSDGRKRDNESGPPGNYA